MSPAPVCSVSTPARPVSAVERAKRNALEVKKPRSESFNGIGFHRSASARLVVSVPRDINIIAKSGDGSIRIERVNGRLELRTGDGSIRASEVSGELQFDTGDGSVTVENAMGRLAVDTS